MFDRFIKLLNRYTELNAKEVDYLWKIRNQIPAQTYRKNEVIFRAGQIFNTMYFVLNGCVRLYYNNNGNEKTAFFYTKGKFFRAVESYRDEIPARENYQAIEDTTLLLFHRSFLRQLMKQYAKFEHIAQLAVEDELITAQNMISTFVTKSPEQRYLELIKNNQELFKNINQHYIASYLGVTPESLSRIKKRALMKEKN